jgi:hypothetical protein
MEIAMNTLEVMKTDYIPHSRQFSPTLTVPESYIGQKVEIWVFPIHDLLEGTSITVNASSEPMSDFFAEVDKLRKIEPVDEALDSIIASPMKFKEIDAL